MPKCKVHAISVTSNNFTPSGNYYTAVNIINSLKFAIPFRLKKVLILGSGALGRVAHQLFSTLRFCGDQFCRIKKAKHGIK